MSDRTALQVIVLSCPLERVRAVLAVLTEHSLAVGDEDAVVLREQYLNADSEMQMGVAVFARIQELLTLEATTI